MNKVILMGRLTRDPDVQCLQREDTLTIAKFTLAVDRRRQNQTVEQTADFINIVAFGRLGEFAEKYLHKGTKVALSGRIQTGSYTNKDGVRVYTTDIIADDIEFAESKNAGAGAGNAPQQTAASAGDGFMNIPDGIDEELPFH